MTFVTDECVIQRATALLEAFDQTHQIRSVVDEFRRGIPDIEWIESLARRDPKPHVLSGDGRILSNRAERRALRESGLTFFLLERGWTNLPWAEYAWRLIRVWPHVLAEAQRVSRPSLFRISPNKLKIARESGW